MLNQKQKDFILENYKNGKSINFIAKEIGISWETTKRFLLKEGVSLNKNINQFQKEQDLSSLFEKVDNPETAYWLGFLYADGSIRSGTRNEISLDLKEEDLETIKAFHSFCKNNNNIREHIIRRNGKEFKSYVSSFSNKKVKENLIKLGCVPKKSLVLEFPSEEQVPQEFLYDFIRGYFDGDGYGRYDLEKHKYDIVILGTEAFLNGAAMRLGILNIVKIQSTNTKAFSLAIYGKENVYNFLKNLYDNDRIALARKKQIFLQAQSGF